MRCQILGLGIDIADPKRISRVRARHDIMRQVLSEDEAYMWPLTADVAAYVWATKEAVSKALGTGFWQKGIEWTDVCLARDGTIRLSGSAASLAGDSQFHVKQIRCEGKVIVVAIRYVGDLPSTLVDNLLKTTNPSLGI